MVERRVGHEECGGGDVYAGLRTNMATNKTKEFDGQSFHSPIGGVLCTLSLPFSFV